MNEDRPVVNGRDEFESWLREVIHNVWLDGYWYCRNETLRGNTENRSEKLRERLAEDRDRCFEAIVSSPYYQINCVGPQDETSEEKGVRNDLLTFKKAIDNLYWSFSVFQQHYENPR